MASRVSAGAPPFDRHDWFVERGDGRERRYVVDFYFDESRAGEMDAFSVDVRPALDSLSSLEERTKMAVHVWCARVGVPCPFSGRLRRMDERE